MAGRARSPRLSRASLALVVIALLTLAQGTFASADTITIAQYSQRLLGSRALLTSAKSSVPGQRAAFVESARTLLRQTSAVRLADGRLVAIDDAAVAARVAPDDDALDRAVADIELLLLHVARVSSPGAVDPSVAQARLRELVGEQRVRDAPQTLATAIAAAITGFIASLRGAAPDARIVLVVVGGLGLALLLVVVGLLGRDLRERFRREVVAAELRRERASDPGAHLRAADAALAAGRARDAVHALYRYALAALAATEAISFDPALTDRELLVRAVAIPNADALRDLVSLHERVWYGLREPDSADSARARQLALRAAA